jgi:endonuclease/exonuclease/phosphatase family metal-dependent hydrolase
MDYLSGYSKFKYGAYAVNWNKKYIPFPYWPPSAHFKKMFSGQSILSKYPITKNKRIVLKRPKNPFYYDLFYLDRLIQVTKVKIGEKLLVVMNIHLEAFDKSIREEQAGFVMEYYTNNFKGKFPVIITGDFNSVPPDAGKKNDFSDEPETDYRNERTIRIFLNEESLSEALPDNIKNPNTFPSVNPDRKLDYIFFSNDKIEMIKTTIVKIHSSDHLPLIMQFRFK